MQEPTGGDPVAGGHLDAWDHVECAMALSGLRARRGAGAAYRWLREHQRADGSWPRPPWRAAVTDPAAESNHAAYVAVGVWHDYLVTGDEGFALAMWPVVRRAIEFVAGAAAARRPDRLGARRRRRGRRRTRC